MKTLLSLFLTLIALNLSAQNYSRVKIYTDQNGINQLIKAGVAVDHGIRKEGVFIISELSQNDLSKLDALHFNYDVLIQDVSNYYVEQNKNTTVDAKNTVCSSQSPIPGGDAVPSNFQVHSTYGGFYKYNEMLQELDNMAALYPSLISSKMTIGTFLTWEGRPLYYVKISNNPTVDNGNPMVLYTAVHHAREPIGMSEVLYYMWFLLENYATNPEVKFLVDNTQMIFVPCINPDGYIHNETTNPNGGGMHRKNKNPSIGSSNPGVDLNRNYGYEWGTSGVSADQNNDTYPGVNAFSEPETQAMRWLVQNMEIKFALNAHSYSNLLLFPIGTQTSVYAPHHTYFQELANYLVQYNGFTAQKSSALYPASGDSDDYMYIDDIGVQQKDTIFAMTPEIGSSFWPASSQIIPLCQQMLFVNLGFAHAVHKFYVVEDNSPSTITELAGDFTHTVKKYGRESGSATVSIEPLQNISTIGTDVTHNLPILGTANGVIAYTLNSSIQPGDSIVYVLVTDDGEWVKRDTIVKFYNGGFDTLLYENGDDVTNWTGNWTTSSLLYYSPSKSITDSQGNYPNNTTKTITYSTPIDLTDATSAKASFYARWDIEKDYDYCQFQVSTDNGATWIAQCGNYTVASSGQSGTIQPQNQPLWDGVKNSWVEESIDLSDYLGQSIQIRFILKSDGGVRKDGFYFDDFKILAALDTTTTSNASIQSQGTSSIVVFPNPATDNIQIKHAKHNDRVTIYDLSGKIIYTTTINNEEQTIVQLSGIASGSYLVKITGENSNFIEQLLIER
ncbi:MAG: immune inhibitor A [Crocinitomicaceae bacterium]|nr:immune inhibitor A [Crocinitomicaceae bacterium]